LSAQRASLRRAPFCSVVMNRNLSYGEKRIKLLRKETFKKQNAGEQRRQADSRFGRKVQADSAAAARKVSPAPSA